ncbi:unnamed protein product [Caenorhabditis nigoni]
MRAPSGIAECRCLGKREPLEGVRNKAFVISFQTSCDACSTGRSATYITTPRMRIFAVSKTFFSTLCAAIGVESFHTDTLAVLFVASHSLRSWMIPLRIRQHCCIKHGKPSDYGPNFGDTFKIRTLSE